MATEKSENMGGTLILTISRVGRQIYSKRDTLSEQHNFKKKTAGVVSLLQ